MMLGKLEEVLFLHGLGSSPASSKAQIFNQHLSSEGVKCHIPDLNLPSFERLSPVQLVDVVRNMLLTLPDGAAGIGTSFGGYLILHALSRMELSQRQRLGAVALLAPALNPWDEAGSLLTKDRLAQWKSRGTSPLRDLRVERDVEVHYRFVEELELLGIAPLVTDLPLLIVHGVRDEVVPITASRAYAGKARNATLVELDDHHQLLKDPEKLLKIVREFFVAHSEH